MPDFQDVLHSPRAEHLMQDASRLERLRTAPETQRIFELLGRNAGGNLEQAAGRAAQGDTEELMGAIRALMRDPEGQRLLRQMKQSLGEK